MVHKSCIFWGIIGCKFDPSAQKYILSLYGIIIQSGYRAGPCILHSVSAEKGVKYLDSAKRMVLPATRCDKNKVDKSPIL